MVARGGGKGEEYLGDLGWTYTCCYLFKMDNQHGPTVRQPGWEGSLGENGYMCM